MKKLSITGLIAVLVALVVFFATGCTVKETKVIEATTTEAPATTAEPTTTTSARQPMRLTVSEAIAEAQNGAPSLYIYTDSEMIQLMEVACDTLSEWGGDYDAFLQNAIQTMSDESASLIEETSALITAATYSICTEHQIGLLDALDRANGLS